MTIPNFITVGRLMLVPIVIVMILQQRWQAAFGFFLAAGVSDAIDGFLARKLDMRSELGAYLDPLADKALLVSIYVTLAMTGHIPAWLAVLVVSRDVMIVSAVIISWIMSKPVEIRPFFVSKVNTAAQIGFAAGLLGARAFGIELGLWEDFAVGAVAALTVASMAAYLTFWLRHMAE